MFEIIPVFLDHVFHPLLKETQFMTEVYHMDQDARHQGVVYCEMASRENTEDDLLDINLRRLLFCNETTYSHECGGFTKHIMNLANHNVQEYHAQFYHPDNTTMVICGSINPENLFAKLEDHSYLFDRKGKETIPILPVLQIPSINRAAWDKKSILVPVPSTEEDIGSITFGKPFIQSKNKIYKFRMAGTCFRRFQDNGGIRCII